MAKLESKVKIQIWIMLVQKFDFFNETKIKYYGHGHFQLKKNFFELIDYRRLFHRHHSVVPLNLIILFSSHGKGKLASS